MDELEVAQEAVRKDESNLREAEVTRRELAKELQQYLDRRDAFENVEQLKSINRTIAETENRIVENIAITEVITTRIKGRKDAVVRLIRTRFEKDERPGLTKQVVEISDTCLSLLETLIAEISIHHTSMVRINAPLQSKSQDLLNTRERKAESHVTIIDLLLGHCREGLATAKTKLGMPR